MKKIALECLAASVMLMSCKQSDNVAKTNAAENLPVKAGRLCSETEAQKMATAPTNMGPLYQQTCLAYTDKQGDMNLAYLMTDLSATLISKFLGPLGKKFSASTRSNSTPVLNRWDPEFLNTYPFDINPTLANAGQFIPNGSQKLQTILPGYALALELNKDKTFAGKKAPIETTRFMKMFAALVQKTQIPPFLGKVHQFSIAPTELRKNFALPPGSAFSGMTKDEIFDAIEKNSVSKLFSSLALGVTSRVLYTGGERELLQYMAARPDGSIQIHELFEVAYRMHDGDVYLTLLTIENTLSRWWRITNRDNLMTTRKLANITNSYMGRGDRYGAWYHFFGIALLGLVEKDFAKVSAEAESTGSHVLNDMNKIVEDESQEDAINEVGANCGVALSSLLQETAQLSGNEKISAIAKKFGISGENALKMALNPDNYLLLDEDFRDRLAMPLTPTLKITVAPDAISLTNTAASLIGCHVEIIPVNSTTQSRDSRLLRHFTSDLMSGVAQKYLASAWLANSAMLKGSRFIVSGCQNAPEKVFVAE